MDFDTLLQAYLPHGWTICFLSDLGHGCWQVNIHDGEHHTHATGGSIEEALALAATRALEGEFSGRVFDGLNGLRAEERASVNSILAGFGQKPMPIRRRL